MTRRAVASLLGALAIVAMAACGKSESSKAQYLTRANAVCAQENKSVKRLAEIRHTPIDKIRESFRIRERANAQLRTIRIPPREKVPTEWLRLRKTAIAEARKILATKPHSRENDAANKAYTRAETAAVRIALSYGLRECTGLAST